MEPCNLEILGEQQVCLKMALNEILGTSPSRLGALQRHKWGQKMKAKSGVTSTKIGITPFRILVYTVYTLQSLYNIWINPFGRFHT